MSLSVVEPAQMLQLLRATDHLPECCTPERSFEHCEWCQWALCTPEITQLIQIRDDLGELTHSGHGHTVAWVVASTQLLESHQALELSAIRVPSARVLAAQLLEEITDSLTPLRRQLSSAVAPDGEIAERCLHTAGVIASAAIQQPQYAELLEQLPIPTQQQLRRLAASLSSELQIAAMLPMVDHLHWQGLPALCSQPEWDRRPQPGGAASLQTRQLSGTNLNPGSLESLVVESMFNSVTEQLNEMSEQLHHAAPAVTVSRPLGSGRHSQRTRMMIYRIAKIDWHLSFVDTGLATCWNARIEGDHMVTDLPWQVALAIEACEPHGLVSACYQDAPQRTASQFVAQDEETSDSQLAT